MVDWTDPIERRCPMSKKKDKKDKKKKDKKKKSKKK